MHHKSPLALSLLALAALSACNGDQSESINDTIADPMEQELANAAPVEAPPMIQKQDDYRCKDNSLVTVQFMTNNSVQVRTEEGGPLTILTAAAAEGNETAPADTFTSADGSMTLSGSGETITFNGQSCKA
jgi:hypothetical protein